MGLSTNSPVGLGVSPTASNPTNFFSQRFWGFISLRWNPGLCGLSRSPFVLLGLSSHKCGTTSHHLTCPGPPTTTLLHALSAPASHLCPSFLSPPLLPVWMSVSLTPWLLDFCTVWSSGSSGCLLFLNLLLSFFQLCEEGKCFYLCLHLGQS